MPRFETLPRIHLGAFPTPLEEASRLSAALGGPRILVKRDDLTGLALGGNKTRKLEYLMAEAVAEGADVVVTVGAAQSNHCRQTAAAAAKVGLRCVLVLDPSEHNEPQGNLLLDHLLGAEVQLREPGAQPPLEDALLEAADAERRAGHRPYVVPLGGSSGVGAIGYVAAVLELAGQLRSMGVSADRLYLSSGSGGTQAGLILGKSIFGSTYDVVGVSPGRCAADVRERCVLAADDGARLLGLDRAFTIDAFTVLDEFVGAGYGATTEASLEAIRLFAQTEALILDPVYTAKAAAAMIDHIRRGSIGKDETVLFLHTGGTPSLFAYHQEVGATVH